MTYDPSIPLSTDYVGNSQQPIKDNFTQLNSQFGIDHISFNTGSGNGTGFHKKVTFTGPIASPAVSSTQGINYPKAVSVTTPSSTNTELFYKNTTKDVQITSSALDSTAGEGFTPGGLQIRCGVAAITSGNSGATVTFTKEFPTQLISVSAISNSSFNLLAASSISPGQKANVVINRQGTTGTASFYYIAIGY